MINPKGHIVRVPRSRVKGLLKKHFKLYDPNWKLEQEDKGLSRVGKPSDKVIRRLLEDEQDPAPISHSMPPKTFIGTEDAPKETKAEDILEVMEV